MKTLRPVVSRAFCEERLALIFPRGAFDSTMSNPLAAAAVSAMIYVGAVEVLGLERDEIRYARPSTVLWLQDDVLLQTDEGPRTAWYEAAVGPNAKVKTKAVVQSLGLSFNQWYSDNTRETLRDETFPKWREQGAIIDRPGIKTTSSAPRWSLASAFADLFNPELVGDELVIAIDSWVETYMSAAGKLRAMGVRQMAQASHAVHVMFPTGEDRMLQPGMASEIIKGVIEEWAPRRLKSPMVLTISEPGEKSYVADQKNLQALGISIDVSKLLPDALLADYSADPPEFWIVEAIATDGEINESRKQALLEWASAQNIPEESCRFLNAFASRNSAPAKRRLKDLAAGTHAWYLDEPSGELAWYEIADDQDTATITAIRPPQE